MKLISFVIVSLTIIFPLVANAKPTVELDVELQASLERFQQLRENNLLLLSCVENFRDDLRPMLQEFGEWVVDVFGRMGYIIELRRQCDGIYMSDPPTRWEEFQRYLCETTFRGLVILEAGRLAYEIRQKVLSYPIIVRESVERFLECIQYEIPELSEFPPRPSLPSLPTLPLLPSLHRD